MDGGNCGRIVQRDNCYYKKSLKFIVGKFFCLGEVDERIVSVRDKGCFFRGFFLGPPPFLCIPLFYSESE